MRMLVVRAEASTWVKGEGNLSYNAAGFNSKRPKTGSPSMNRLREPHIRPAAQSSPGEWAKLIRKLRWIGLEDEARSLQLAVSTLPAEERGSVLAQPFSTD
jgi:hypothetical protein